MTPPIEGNYEARNHFEPIALVGMSCLFPGKTGNQGYWHTLLAGVDRIREIPPGRWRPEDHYNPDPKAPDMVYARRGAFLDPVPFNPSEFGIAPNSLEATDTAQLLGMFAAREALRDAGYAATPDEPGKLFPRERTSVVVGVTSALELLIPLGARLDHPKWRKAMLEAGVPQDRVEDAIARIGQNYPEWTEDSFPGLLGNVVAGRIANRFDLGGANCVVDAACASSLGALHLAALELQAGRSDLVISGGVDTFSDVFMYACFSKTPALSASGNSKPFSAEGDGTILGEGIGLVVLKRLADAQRDNDRILAVLKGLGAGSDGRGGAIYAPRKEGQIRTISRALDQAGCLPSSIGLLEAHGTGTRAGDQVELAALIEVFGKGSSASATPWCALGSVKSQIGHAKGAAGTAGLLKATLALRHGVQPPTLKVGTPLPALLEPGCPFHLPSRARPWLKPMNGQPRRAGVSAFGFGGSNFHAILEESATPCQTPAWDGSIQIIALSADNHEDLAAAVSVVPSAADTGFAWFARESRRTFHPSAKFRLVAVRELESNQTDDDFQKILQGAITALSSGTNWYASAGVRASSGPRRTRLALLFPGQGAQRVDSFRELACVFPEMRHELENARDAMAVAFPELRKLDDLLYPPASSNPDEVLANLRDTRVCQVAMAALGLGAAKVLRRFHVGSRVGNLSAGHSLGEWTALAAAGLLPDSSWYSLLARRAGLMHQESLTRPGSMLAVLAHRTDAAKLAQRVHGVSVANHNGPRQTILSGPSAAIDQCELLAKEMGLAVRRLDVAGAFHHPDLAAAARALAATLSEAHLPVDPGQAMATTVLANLDAKPYQPGEPGWLERLHRQVSEPVLWQECLEELRRQGAEVFLEVGPGGILTRMAQDVLSDIPDISARALSLEGEPGRPGELGRLAITLAHLAALGVDVNLTPWENDSPAHAPAAKPKMLVPLAGANYRKPRPTRPPLPPIQVASHRDDMPLAPVPAPIPFVPVARVERVAMSQPVPPDPSHHRMPIVDQALSLFARMQEDAARLHKMFLESQEASQKTLLALLEGRAPAAVLMPLAAVATSTQVAPVSVAAPVMVPQPPTPKVQPAIVAAPKAFFVPPVQVPVSSFPVSHDATGILAKLQEIVAEKTGYPVEALEPDLALDSDLGIDSIKRVEILASVQDRLPGTRPVGPEHSGTLRTLNELANYLVGGAAIAVPIALKAVAPIAVPSSSPLGILAKLQEIVAEKTGYPVEALEPDLALDSDLGIDSIKRVEILASVQDRLPGTRPVGPEQSGSLRTLNELAAWLTGSVVPPAPPQVPPVPKPEPVVAAAPIAVVAPAEKKDSAIQGNRQLDLHVVRSHPLGTDRPRLNLAQGARVLVVAPENEPVAGLADALVARYGWTVENRRLEEIPNVGSRLDGLILAPGSSARRDGGGMIANWLKAASPLLRAAGQSASALLVGVGRMDGAWGRASADWSKNLDWDPEQAAILGAVKTASWEWPEVTVRAIDLARDDRSGWQYFADELGFPGPLETGISPTGTVELVLAQAHENGTGAPQLARGDVILAVGGARGVTADGVRALATQSGASVGMVGRTPLEEPPWAIGLPDETALIRNCVSTQGLAPRQAQENARKVLASREARASIDELRRLGIKVAYQVADAGDPAALAHAVRALRVELGPISALVHGAGVLADGRIEQMDSRQCARVWEPKAAALGNLIEELASDPLKLVALYGSSTGRFGRVGQLPYAMSNATLAAWAARIRLDRPGVRSVCFDWGPFAGGMVNEGLAKLFASEGVGLIDPPAGGELLARVVGCQSALGAESEIVVLAAGSALPAVSRPIPVAKVRPRTDLPQAGDPDIDISSREIVFERMVSVVSHPCLEDHVLDGRAVVPLALGMEWMAHAAATGQPGLEVAELADIAVLSGLQLYQGSETRVLALAGQPLRADDRVETLIDLTAADEKRPMFRAKVRLGRRDPSPRSRHSDPTEAAEIAAGRLVGEVWEPGYGSSLFHGAAWQALDQVRFLGDDRLLALVRACPAPSTMMKAPLRGHWLLDPWAVDSLFQVMILAAQRNGHPGCLPTRISQLRIFARFDPAGSRLLVHLLRKGPHLMVADCEWEDVSGRVVAQARGVECAIDASLGRAFRKNRILVAGGT